MDPSFLQLEVESGANIHDYTLRQLHVDQELDARHHQQIQQK
jgi:hypothetical protein